MSYRTSEMTKADFVKKYPNANLSDFIFVSSDRSPDGEAHTYYRVNPEYRISIHSDEFKRYHIAALGRPLTPVELALRKKFGSDWRRLSAIADKEESIERSSFLKSYPDADLSKFSFSADSTSFVVGGGGGGLSYDIRSKTFLSNPDWTKYLYVNITTNKEIADSWRKIREDIPRTPEVIITPAEKIPPKRKGWSKIWLPQDNIPVFSHLRRPNNPQRHNEVIFQAPINLGYSFNAFRIYVSETESFVSNFPPIRASWEKGRTLNEVVGTSIAKVPLDYIKEPYFTMICAAYVASFLCGISFDHIRGSKDTPKIITSIARYHLYYQIRKFMKTPTKLNPYSGLFTGPVKARIPTRHHSVDSLGPDEDGNYYAIMARVNWSDRDYLSMIAYETFGLTGIGQKLLQESIESYVYSVLGAQAQTRWSIVGAGAKSSQTQDVFYKIVEDTIIQGDQTVTISDMRKSIQDTNVVLNLAISPGVILSPSRMVILEKAIVGYNNILTIATKDMSFGKNGGVNYKKPPVQKKPVVEDKDEGDSGKKEDKNPQRTPERPPAKGAPPQDHLVNSTENGSELTSFLLSGALAFIIPRIFLS